MSAAPEAARGWEAVATLYHSFFAGLLLTVATKRGAVDAGELMFHTFRRQHHEKFLSSLAKLGLADLPDAVKAAGYHYMSNRIGGVKVEFMRESDRKAWVHFPPPRWIYDGTAACGVPTEVSRGFLRGWYAHNGVSLGNPRLGFVCTSQLIDGGAGLSGYFLEHDRDLAPEERLRFSPGEEPPPFDEEVAPKLPEGIWSPERLAKARRNYAMEYSRSVLPEMAALFGPADAAALANRTGRLIGMQTYDRTAGFLGIAPGGAEGFARFLAAMAEGQGDEAAVARDGDAWLVRQTSWRLTRGLPSLSPAVFEGWNGLWQGACAAHDRFLVLEVLRRLDYGDPYIEWRVRRR